MEIDLTIQVWQRERWFVATCPELDFVSQGDTREEAKENLIEVVQIQLEEMAELGTLDDYLAECGYVRQDGHLTRQSEMVDVETIKTNMRTVGMSREDCFRLAREV